MKEYTVSINGLDHTVLLDDADAEARSAAPVKQSKQPKNKARQPEDKSG